MTRTRTSLAALAVFMAVLVTAIPAFGQETTGGLQGDVTVKSDKSPLPGATVEAVHVPTGTRYTAVTSATGRFSILNVRVGGPYTVTAKLTGFRTETFKDITIALGERRYLSFELNIEAVQQSVMVTAEAEPLISPNRMGSSRVDFGRRDQVPADDSPAVPGLRPDEPIRQRAGLRHDADQHHRGGEEQPVQHDPDRRSGQQRPVRPLHDRHPGRPDRHAAHLAGRPFRSFRSPSHLTTSSRGDSLAAPST